MEDVYQLRLLVLVTVLVLICDHVTLADTKTRLHGRRNRIRRTVGMDPSLFRAYLDLHQQQPPTTTVSSPVMARFVPPVPEQSDVECYIDVVRIRRRGGRCTKLGGNSTRPFICQRGPDFEFQDDCRLIFEERERELLQQLQQQIYP